ncbi:MAG: S1 family peptidase [Firmicutes bacterium]|nr:S1 family peptidase [Bacillota bacterium]
MKKKLIVLLSLIVFALIGIAMTLNVSEVKRVIETKSIEIFSSAYFANVNRSIEILEQSMNKFIVDDTIANNTIGSFENQSSHESINRNTINRNTYSDEFAGRWFCEQGFLNIGIVGSNSRVNSLQITSNYNGQVQYIRHRYSLNHLYNIIEILDTMTNNYGVISIALNEELNHIKIYVNNKNVINQINYYLYKNSLYSSSALKITIQSEVGVKRDSNTAYGGSPLFRGPGLPRGHQGTIAVNARCNTTGQFGFLTNGHVVHCMTTGRWIERLYNSTGWFAPRLGVPCPIRYQNGGTIDAAFVPFYNQNNWTPTHHARGSTTYTNIRLGSEHLIIQGAPIRRIGHITGDTTGIILYTDVIADGIRRSFTYSNAGQNGDSGGPVFFDGGNQNLFLIGMHFASNSARTHGIACRISEVMLPRSQGGLDITPITSNANMTQMRNGIYILPSQAGREIHLHGTNNVLNTQIQFVSGQTRTFSITGTNGDRTILSTSASEWQGLNITLFNINFIRIRFYTNSFRIQAAANANFIVWEQTFRLGPSIFPFNNIGQIQLNVTNSAHASNRIFGRINSFIPRSAAISSYTHPNNMINNYNSIFFSNSFS